MEFQSKDRVVIQGGDRVYTVQAVAQTGHDVYLTDGSDTSIGTWVDVRQVAHASKPNASGPNEADPHCVWPNRVCTCGEPEGYTAPPSSDGGDDRG